MISRWVSDGSLDQPTGKWTLQADADRLSSDVPEMLRQLIARQIARLAPAEQEVLDAASIVGAEFAVAVAAAGIGWDEEAVEEQCDRLASQGRLLRTMSPVEWPDGTVSARYEFIHSLYQEVLYARIPRARQIRLHRRAGDRLEIGYERSR